MNITVNKTLREVNSNCSLLDLLEEIQMAPEKTLVSINDEIIPQKDYAKNSLKENDEVDLFSFVGGG